MESVTGEKTASCIHFHPDAEAPSAPISSKTSKPSDGKAKKINNILDVDPRKSSKPSRRPQLGNSKNSNSKSPIPDHSNSTANSPAQLSSNSMGITASAAVSEPAFPDGLSDLTDSELDEMDRMHLKEVEDFRAKLAGINHELPAKRICLWRATVTADDQIIHDSTFGSFLQPFLKFIANCTGPQPSGQNRVLKLENLSKSHVPASETAIKEIKCYSLIDILDILFKMELINMVCSISISQADPTSSQMVYLENENTKCISALFN